MTVFSEKIMTPEEYLTLERNKHPDEDRSELLNGKIIEMPGGSPNHAAIAAMIIYLLMSEFFDKEEYSVFGSDLKVNNPFKNHHYPDILVIKGDLEYQDDQKDVVKNPLLIVEVLSKSTGAYDRSEKFLSYRQIPSLEEYVLVSQDKYLIESFYKNEKGQWIVGEVAEGKESKFTFTSLNIELSLEDIYKKIEF